VRGFGRGNTWAHPFPAERHDNCIVVPGHGQLMVGPKPRLTMFMRRDSSVAFAQAASPALRLLRGMSFDSYCLAEFGPSELADAQARVTPFWLVGSRRVAQRTSGP
jgi:hypothetical protein